MRMAVTIENDAEPPPKRKRGRPRKPWDELKPCSKRARRWRDPSSAPPKLSEARLLVPAEKKPPREPKKPGRPRLPDELLSDEGRRMRKYRDKLAQRAQIEQADPAGLNMITDAAAELARVDAECKADDGQCPT